MKSAVDKPLGVTALLESRLFAMKTSVYCSLTNRTIDWEKLERLDPGERMDTIRHSPGINMNKIFEAEYGIKFPQGTFVTYKEYAGVLMAYHSREVLGQIGQIVCRLNRMDSTPW